MSKIRNADLGRKTTEEFRASEKEPVVLVLDNVRSLNNIGSAFRSADAFLIDRILLCGITATPPHREIHKTALGAEETVRWEYHKETTGALNQLKQEGYRLIAIEQTEGCYPLNKFTADPSEKVAFIFGHEIDGVSDAALALADEAIEIPQFGSKHSINVSVCVGIVLWQYFIATTH
jgi:23S rRNA (guanosine2251-2'-O)-methyltransferase